MPEIQLDFPNPLNVSVQIGDVAYFSNPTPVGLQQSWTATTTPHMSNAQDGIIKIGEILSIIPWDGFVSSIICDMPQDLYNQYYAQIAAGGCTLVPDPNSACTGDCCDITPVIDYPVFDYSTSPPGQMGFHNFEYFFSNPTVKTDEVMLHHARANIASSNPPTCMVDPGVKNVNGVDDYVAGLDNYWIRHYMFLQAGLDPTSIQARDDWQATFMTGSGIGGGHSHSANDLIGHLISFYPNDYYFGMTYQQAKDARTDINIAGMVGNVTGSLSVQTQEICTQGSFIMFSKDNKANMSDMLGYYASIELRNSSKTEAELFNVGTTFFESSK